MSGTALDNPLVHSYLRELDDALARLPARQSSELHEQIVAHLADALAPDASDEQVATVLARLGSPADLAAEAAAGTPADTPATAVQLPRWKPAQRNPVQGTRRVWSSWRFWVTVAPIVAVMAILAGIIVVDETAPVLIQSGLSTWWYPQDSAHAVDTSADGRFQTTVPIRSGQWQGFVVDLFNNSDETQTILGPAFGNGVPEAFVGSGGSGGFRGIIGVNTPNTEVDGGGGVFTGVKFVLPGVIPPHQTRAMRVMWLSTGCLMRGSASGNDELAVRVRIGWIPRTEVISLDQGWYVSGPSTGKYACS